MKPLIMVGIVLIVFGIGSLIYNVIPIHHTEQIAKIGSLTATEDKENDVVVPTVVSVLALLAGGALVFAARRT